VGLNSLKSLNLTNVYPNNKNKNKNNNNNNKKKNNNVKSKPLELRSRVKNRAVVRITVVKFGDITSQLQSHIFTNFSLPIFLISNFFKLYSSIKQTIKQTKKIV
jgi:hypothetical protein